MNDFIQKNKKYLARLNEESRKKILLDYLNTLPKMSNEEEQRRHQINLDNEFYTCDCFIYQGYYIPLGNWCNYCSIYSDPRINSNQNSRQCINCYRIFLIRKNYNGKYPLCSTCRKNKNF